MLPHLQFFAVDTVFSKNGLFLRVSYGFGDMSKTVDLIIDIFRFQDKLHVYCLLPNITYLLIYNCIMYDFFFARAFGARLILIIFWSATSYPISYTMQGKSEYQAHYSFEARLWSITLI